MKLAVAATLLLAASTARAGAPIFTVDADLREGDSGGDTVIDPKDFTITASSTLCEKKPKLCHDAASLVDDKTATAWCEGVAGDGQGETITITFAKPEKLTGFFLVPDFAKSFALAEQNNRVASIEITTDAGTDVADLDDVVPKVKRENGVKEVSDPCGCGDETCSSRDERIQYGIGSQITFGQVKGKDFVEAPVTTKTLVIKIKGVHRGTKYHDTCASELTVHRAK